MSLGLAYYICLLLYLILGFWVTGFGNPRVWGGNLLLFILLLLLGWKCFGPPLHS